MEGSTNTFEHYSEFCNTQKAEALAHHAVLAVIDAMTKYSSHEQDCLEAAQLLLEGWKPGQKVVLL